MHGSSMFRRKAFKKAGGYQKKRDLPEDHGLFQRIVKSGWDAKRTPFPLLEYRQHSSQQSNIVFGSYAELNYYKNRYRELLPIYEKEHSELEKIKSSKMWKLLFIYKDPKKAIPHYIRRIKDKLVKS